MNASQLVSAAAALLLLASCGIVGENERDFRGVIVADPSMDNGDTTVGGGIVSFMVELVGATHKDSARAIVHVPIEEMRCHDGEELSVAEVRAGQEVEFIGLIGGETPSMQPPPMRAREFRVDC